MIAAGDVPEYDALVEKHGLSILMEPGDFSLVNGDLRLTKDGDLQVGDTTYSAMFRLVQAWRFSRPHLAQVFGLSIEMAEALRRHAEQTEKITLKTHNAYDLAKSTQDHFAPLREAFEASEAIELGKSYMPAALCFSWTGCCGVSAKTSPLGTPGATRSPSSTESPLAAS